MAKEIKMPKYGQTMEEGKIVRWLKEVGDYIEEGEIFLEIEGDKSLLEVESEYSGYLLKIIAMVDEVIPCGGTICYIGEKDEELT
jgi:pyruvate/2-oxoglutarate dehydrogenase complex dihydrolipoamide acyltransferase (E2) component